MKTLTRFLATLSLICGAISVAASGPVFVSPSEAKATPSDFRPGGLFSIPIGSITKNKAGYVLQRAQAYDLCAVHKSSGHWQCVTLDAPYVPIAELFATPVVGPRQHPSIGLRLHAMPDWSPSPVEALELADRLASALDAARMRLLDRGPQQKTLDPEDDDPIEGPIVLEPIEVVGAGTGGGGSDFWYWELEDLFADPPAVQRTTEQCKKDCDDRYDAASAICRRQSGSRARALCWARAAVIYSACLYKCS